MVVPAGGEETGAGGDGWRWREVDPFGRQVRCGEREWAGKVALRPELAPHEAVIRATVRDPDRIYLDPDSTATRRRHGNPRAVMLHYLGLNRGQGAQQGNAVCVVVKLLPDEVTGGVVGYVASAWLPNAPQVRLQLVWSRPSR